MLSPNFQIFPTFHNLSGLNLKSYKKFLILDILLNFTLKNANLCQNTVNCQNVMTKSAELFMESNNKFRN